MKLVKFLNCGVVHLRSNSATPSQGGSGSGVTARGEGSLAL